MDRAEEACASFSTARVSRTGRVAEACSSFSAHGSGARGVSESHVRGFLVEHGACSLASTGRVLWLHGACSSPYFWTEVGNSDCFIVFNIWKK